MKRIGAWLRRLRLPDWARRAFRTFLQAFVGTMSVTLLPLLNDMAQAIGNNEDVTLEPSFFQAMLFSSLIAGVAALFAGLQNALEDNTKMPAVGKAPASQGVNPVPDDAPNGLP